MTCEPGAGLADGLMVGAVDTDLAAAVDLVEARVRLQQNGVAVRPARRVEDDIDERPILVNQFDRGVQYGQLTGAPVGKGDHRRRPQAGEGARGLRRGAADRRRAGLGE